MTVALETLLQRSLKNIGAVHASLKEYVEELIKRCYKEGILVQMSSGYRSNEEQAALYGQGRASYIYNGKQYGKLTDNTGKKLAIVTNATPGSSIHNYGLAVDYFLVSDDGLTALWTVNEKWRRVATIAKSMGFSWGGDWTSFVDYPHLEYTKGLSINQLKAGLRPAFPKLITTNIKEETKVVEQTLTAAQEKIRQEAMRLGITDGKDPFRPVNQFYSWAVAIPQAKKNEELEKRIAELEKKIK